MDEIIFHLINEQWTSLALDLFMAVISRADIWTPFFIVAGLVILIFGGFRGRAFVFCTLLILGLSNAAIDPLKAAVARPRPKQVQAARMIELIKTRPMLLTLWQRPIVRFSTEEERSRSGSSFPSGHTNNNTVIAICCMMFYRRWGALYWIIAAAVAYSRIYLAAHWPSDVVGTFFLAAGETLLLLGLLELLWSKWIAPRWPKLGHPHLFPVRAR